MNTLVVCIRCGKLNRVSLERASVAKPICGSCKTELPIHGGVQEVSDIGLKKLIQNAEAPLVVDFWAEWCGPCKAFAPTFMEAAQQLGAKFIFAKLNTETYPAASQEYQINGIPTLLIFKNGKELERQSGAMQLPIFLSFLNRLNR